MCEKIKGSVGLSGSARSLSNPQFCGCEDNNYNPLKSPRQFSGVASDLEKEWLYSALPDDWRALPSPLEKLLSNNLGLAGCRRSTQDDVQSLSSIVAKVQDGVNFSFVPPPPPVVGVRFFSNDVQLVRGISPARGGGPRQKCGQISASSLKNAKFTIANSEPQLFSLIACTYPVTFPADGRIVKAHHKALLQRIRDKFGSFSYFTAFEYQKRGAVHFHTAISFNLSELGDVVTVKRKAMGRRFPTFLTVLDLNRWLFEAWLDIISRSGEVRYKKEVLDWAGLPAADIENMKKAFYQYNSAVSWEVMREDNGAKHYMVKELSGLKSYQKIVPDWYASPGRHFLYSRDMRVGDPFQEFVIGDSEVRDILEAIDWAWMPRGGASINRTIWNVAADMVLELLRRGYRPCSSDRSLEALRRFDDLRMVEFMGSSSLYSEGTVSAWFSYNEAIIRHREIKWAILHKESQWRRDFLEIEQAFSSSSPPPVPPPGVRYTQSEIDFTSTLCL